MMIVQLIKPVVVNMVLQREEAHGNLMSVMDYYTWLNAMDTCFPRLAREYVSNAIKLELNPTDVNYKVNGLTALDYQSTLHCTVFEAYKAMTQVAAKMEQ